MTADLHIHTNASDGLLTPEEVVSEAVSAGLGLIAVTDHDTSFNCGKLNTFAQNYNIRTVTGVEISAYEGGVKLHTLGYGFDPSHPAFVRFENNLFNGAEERLRDILKKLKSSGINLCTEEVYAQRAFKNTPVHAMHICRVGAKRGFAGNPMEFYKNYLAPGREVFSEVCRPTPESALNAINSAGGIAVLAHPGRIWLEKDKLKDLVIRLAEEGLAGIEAVYTTHTPYETAYFKELAESLGLFITGGSDTHFKGGDKRIGKPEFHPSEKLRQRLKI